MVKSWDSTWEKVFQTQEWGEYPPEELIRFIARNYYKVQDRKKIRILDVGCGTGAATWYIAREGFSVYGIDGSKTAIRLLKKRFRNEKLNGEFRVGDFIKLDYPDNFFDCVIDIKALQHNKIRKLKKILTQIFRVLKPGGKIFSIVANKRTGSGDKINNLLSGKCFIHYFDKKEIENLFSKFTNLNIEISERTDKGDFISYFAINAEKCKQ